LDDGGGPAGALLFVVSVSLALSRALSFQIPIHSLKYLIDELNVNR
jgi:hypothetical protein